MNKWLEIKNSVVNNTAETELMIYGEIGGWWEGLDANTLADAIKNTDSDTINIRMLTYGGSLVTALGVYNVMKASGKKFIIHNDGVIASAGTIIASAGEVHMPKNALYMVHSALTSAHGNAEELRRIADMLDKFDGGIKSIYKDKASLSDEQIDDLMAQDSWLTAEEAKNLGLIDVITNDIQIAANAKGKDTVINGVVMPNLPVKNLPKNILNNVKSTNEKPLEGDKPMDLTQFKANYPGIANQFQAEVENTMKAKIDEAVKAEKQRILDIQDSALPGDEEIVKNAIENNLSAGDFAIMARKAEKTKASAELAKINADAASVPAVINTAVAPEDTKTQLSKEDQILNSLEQSYK